MTINIDKPTYNRKVASFELLLNILHLLLFVLKMYCTMGKAEIYDLNRCSELVSM